MPTDAPAPIPLPAEPKLIIYDLDGTLVDAFDDIYAGVRHAFEQFGIATPPFGRVKSAVGDGAAMLIRRCLGEEHADRFDEVYPAYRAFYADNPAHEVRLYDGVLETLETLRARGLKQAILTNKPDEVVHNLCGPLGLSRLVDGAWGERDDRPRKPDAAALVQVAEHFGLAPGSCVMVGDGPADHAVARNAGIAMVAVTWGLLDRERARALRPSRVIDSISELPGVLNASG